MTTPPVEERLRAALDELAAATPLPRADRPAPRVAPVPAGIAPPPGSDPAGTPGPAGPARPRRWWTEPKVAAAAAAVVALVVGLTVAGLAGHRAPARPAQATTTTAPSSTTTVPPTTSTTAPPVQTTVPPGGGEPGPAVAQAGGVTLSVQSSPASGPLGTTISVTATLSGAVTPGELHFLVGQGPADQGQAATDQTVPVTGPGTYTMPTGYAPPSAGQWGVSVLLLDSANNEVLSVTGLAPSAGAAVPSPQLVTTITG
jgi:hypothetical protein